MRILTCLNHDRMRMEIGCGKKSPHLSKAIWNFVAPMLLAIAVAALLTGGISQRAEAAKYAGGADAAIELIADQTSAVPDLLDALSEAARFAAHRQN